MNHITHATLGAAAALLAISLADTASAQQYPARTVRVVTPYAPGGSTDILARLLSARLTDTWKQQVVVDNRPGGNTIIGSEHVARSPADGYTLMLQTSGHVINPSLLKTPYDAIRDFTGVGTVAVGEFLLVTHPSVAANSVQEFIALARSKPGQINYASSGAGSSTHMASEYFNIVGNVQLSHVHYKGGGPALNDLLGGQVQVTISVPLAFVSHVRGGKLKALAVTGANRMSALPQVPTFAEAGLPAYDASNWYGIFAPTGLPRPIVERWSSELARILSLQDVRDSLISQGMDPLIRTPEQFTEMMKTDLAKYARIIKTAGIKLENN